MTDDGDIRASVVRFSSAPESAQGSLFHVTGRYCPKNSLYTLLVDIIQYRCLYSERARSSVSVVAVTSSCLILN